MKDASQSGWVIEVGDDEFDHEVLERSRQVPVVVDFWAPWCQPCRTLGPMLEALAAEFAGAFVLAKVNVDEAQNLAGYFQVEGIPTVHYVRDGKVFQGFQGVLSQEELREFIKQVFPSEADNVLKEAVALETSDPQQAEKHYREILAKEPDHELARVGLARLLVVQHKNAEAAELLAPLGVAGDVGIEAERLRRIIELEGEAPSGLNEESLRKQVAADLENAEARYQLGALLAAKALYPEALEMLLSAAERDRKLAQNQVRELMVKIFQIIGVRSEMADDYRDRLRALLY